VRAVNRYVRIARDFLLNTGTAPHSDGILETLDMGTWEWRVDTNEVTWSDSLIRLHGRRPDQFDGTLESALRDVHPDDRPSLEEAISATLKENVPFRAEYRCIRPDGTRIWLQSSARCYRDEAGRPLRLRGVCMDVTERKRREQEQVHLASIANSSCEGIVGKTLDGTVTCWNAGAERLFGYTAEEMVGRSIETIVPRERLGEVRMILDTVRRGERVHEFETERVRKDGSRVGVSISASPVFDADGRVIEAATIERENSGPRSVGHPAFASEERFRMIANGAIDLIFMTDTEGRLAYASPSFRHILGYRPEDLVGIRFLDLVHPEDRADLAQWPENQFSEFRARHANGRWIWLEGTTYSVSSRSGRRSVCIARDHTTRKEREQELLHRASHDALTNIPNRALFLDRLTHVVERFQRSAPDYAVLTLDLDDFKLVNDMLGHLAGDRVLVEFTRRVRECLRPGDTFARLGGDEFAILLEEPGGREGVHGVADRIMRTLETPMAAGGTHWRASASIGAVLGNREFTETEQILARADAAMYQAKNAGKGRFVMLER
jgi:diguanylate cyclase (GGDEF)-like protein/PAS domain S-box-containing protein